MKDFNIYTGKRIKNYREKEKLTQEYMAKELDIATNHYGRIERGENSCTLYNLIHICNILKITPNDLLGELIITSEDALTSDINKLSIEDKTIISKFIQFLISKY